VHLPEGQMTRIGQMLPFRRGMERIVKGVEVPIIPVNLGGVWGSIFSFERGKFLWKMPRRIPYPVSVTFGKAMPSTTGAQEVRQAVQELGAEAYQFRKRYMRTLHRSFVQTARRHPFRFAMADGRTPKVTFGKALTGAVFLARRLRSVWQDQSMVGILLPPSVPGALINLAALMMGKVPVNLNYTASNEVLASCAKQCELKTVITSKAFLERVHLEVPTQAVMLEYLAANPRMRDRLTATLISWLLPVRLIEKSVGATRKIGLDDTATIIFSSGSTGDPKGVVLSHYNVAFKRRATESGIHARAQRQDSRHPAFLSFLRFHWNAMSSHEHWDGCGVPSQPARSTRDWRARQPIQSDFPAGNAHVPIGLHPALRARRLRQSPIRNGRRGKASGENFDCI